MQESKNLTPLKIKKVKYSNTQYESIGVREMISEVFSDGEMLQSFDSFSVFITFFNELIECTINETMVENLINRFFNEFLLAKIQPILIEDEDPVITRT
jgi:hypothetical protein